MPQSLPLLFRRRPSGVEMIFLAGDLAAPLGVVPG